MIRNHQTCFKQLKGSLFYVWFSFLFILNVPKFHLGMVFILAWRSGQSSLFQLRLSLFLPYFWRVSFCGYRILGWQFFLWALQITFSHFLVSNASSAVFSSFLPCKYDPVLLLGLFSPWTTSPDAMYMLMSAAQDLLWAPDLYIIIMSLKFTCLWWDFWFIYCCFWVNYVEHLPKPATWRPFFIFCLLVSK